MHRPPSDPLRNLLTETEDELRRRLREACDAEVRGISTESTAEIRRLEDALLKAAMAAGQTLAVRRHIEEQDGGQRSRPARRPEGHYANVAAGTRDVDAAERPAVSGSAGLSDVSLVADARQSTETQLREFTDQGGRSWRAWPVIPDLERRTGSDRRFLGDFHEGWICFEALDSTARRRLPRRETNWSSLEQSDLLRLLDEAIDAPARKPSVARGD